MIQTKHCRQGPDQDNNLQAEPREGDDLPGQVNDNEDTSSDDEPNSGAETRQNFTNNLGKLNLNHNAASYVWIGTVH